MDARVILYTQAALCSYIHIYCASRGRASGECRPGESLFRYNMRTYGVWIASGSDELMGGGIRDIYSRKDELRAQV